MTTPAGSYPQTASSTNSMTTSPSTNPLISPPQITSLQPTTQSTSFLLFPILPIEIQLKIWEVAAANVQLIKVQIYIGVAKRFFMTRDDEEGYRTHRFFGTRSDFAYNSMRKTCKLSRKVFLKANPNILQCMNPARKIMFNAERDTVLLWASNNVSEAFHPRSLRIPRDTEIARMVLPIKNLAIEKNFKGFLSQYTGARGRRERAFVLAYFDNLQHLVLYKEGGKLMRGMINKVKLLTWEDYFSGIIRSVPEWREQRIARGLLGQVAKDIRTWKESSLVKMGELGGFQRGVPTMEFKVLCKADSGYSAGRSR